MSDKTDIEWTATVNPDGSITKGATWNPIRGCTKVSPGCAHCYAETFAERFRGVKGHPYEQGFDLRLVPEKLDDPLKRKKPTKYFVNSMSDLFQDGVDDEFISHVFAIMALCPQHTFQILTKRAERMRDYSQRIADGLDHGIAHAFANYRPMPNQAWGWPLPNVWLGVSVENQHFADTRIPLLLQTPAAVRFISAEPLLAAMDVSPWLCDFELGQGSNGNLHWVIVGGESGLSARPFDIRWVRDIRDQCRSAGVPVFIKQFGASPRCALTTACMFGEGVTIRRHDVHSDEDVLCAGVEMQLRDKKGGDPSEWPIDLRVRQYPDARS